MILDLSANSTRPGRAGWQCSILRGVTCKDYSKTGAGFPRVCVGVLYLCGFYRGKKQQARAFVPIVPICSICFVCVPYVYKCFGTWKNLDKSIVFHVFCSVCSNVPAIFKILYILYIIFLYIFFYFFLFKKVEKFGTLEQTAFWNIKNIDFTGFFGVPIFEIGLEHVPKTLEQCGSCCLFSL